MKKLLLALLITLTMFWALPVAAVTYYSNDFDYFTSDYYSDSAYQPLMMDSTGVNFNFTQMIPYSGFCTSSCGGRTWAFDINTNASRTQGTNKRGFRRHWAWSNYYTSACINCAGCNENMMDHHFSTPITGTVYIRWYERPSWSGITGQYIKIFRLISTAGQAWIPEWNDHGSPYTRRVMDLEMYPFDSNHHIVWNNFDYKAYTEANPNTWTCFELKIDMAGHDADFWVNDALQTKTTIGAWATIGTNISSFEVGGNATPVSVDNNQYADYDEIVVASERIYCSSAPTTVTVGGTISGLSTTSGSLVLYDADQFTTKTITANGTWAFSTAYEVSVDTYNVSILTNPGGQKCTLSNGSGTVGTGNTTNVNVACVASNPSRSGGRHTGGRSR